jgi:5-methylcytosine-specific restriction endonuclease McrA
MSGGESSAVDRLLEALGIDAASYQSYVAGALAEQLSLSKHHRQPIKAEDLLRLLWNSPHVCANCGRRPPEVKLHIDHVFPASRGGSSRFENLQLLCADCNLRKSNKIEVKGLWLSSV